MSVPPSLAYEVVDVFTDRAFAGNPLAVVLDSDGLPTEALQALAAEFNLSETAFPQRTQTPGADYRLRIFTPRVELPFAGHPSVGAAEVLARLGRVGRGRVVQECGAGLLPLVVGPVDPRARGTQARPTEVVLTGGTPSYGDPLDPAPLLAAVGLSPADLRGPTPRACGTGIDWVFLPVRPEALARAAVDPARLAAAAESTGSTGIAVVALLEDGPQAEGPVVAARVFAGGVGVPEDPATGSAALGLGVLLEGAGLLATDDTDGGTVTVRQGVEMGRPSTLRVQVVRGEPLRVTVAGQVVQVARGEVRRPG